MKEHPKTFSAEMMRALLAGKKTRTMRPMKPQPIWHIDNWETNGHGIWYPFSKTEPIDGMSLPVQAPAEVGDVIWSRETWAQRTSGEFLYKANEQEGRLTDGKPNAPAFLWKSPLFQSRSRARFVSPPLTRVFPQRPQDLGIEQCYAEGIARDVFTNPREKFKDLWTSIYGATSWDDNPWCWVYDWGIQHATE